MNLVDEQALSSFVRKIVMEMKPKLKSNINPSDLKTITRLSSKEWLNAKESAQYLSISEPTFRIWRKKYKIPSRTLENVTRWKKSDLDKFYEKHDLIMLKHEAYEANLMDNKGMQYEEAHEKTNLVYNYQKENDKWKKATGHDDGL